MPDAVQRLVAIVKSPQASDEMYASTVANALSSIVKVCHMAARALVFFPGIYILRFLRVIGSHLTSTAPMAADRS